MNTADTVIWKEKGVVYKALYFALTKRLRLTKMVSTAKSELVYVKSNVDSLEWATFKKKVLKK